VGTVLGGVSLASSGNPRGKAVLALSSAVLWSIALAALAASRSFAPAFAALVALGAFQAVVSATTITLLQTRVPSEMRGRVMSLNTLLVMGVRPLGDFAAAGAIEAIGAPRTAATAAALVAAVALAVATRRDVRSA
jgi:hypothetical protein